LPTAFGLRPINNPLPVRHDSCVRRPLLFLDVDGVLNPYGGRVRRRSYSLVVSAEDEEAVRATLAPDTWHNTILTIKSVERWTLWLRSPALTGAIGDDDDH
jgi:hypothetical protein